MTDDIDIAALRELLAKATPGPWQAWDRGIGWEVHDASKNEINSGFRETFSEADAALIAALRNAAPALLDRIETLTAENERLKGIFESANAAASQRTMERDAATRRIEALESALRRSRRGMEVLMPGIGGLAIAAEEISNINFAFIEADRALGADHE